MKKSIFSKILGSYFLIIFMLAGSILIVSHITIKNFYIDTLTSSLIKNGVTLNLKISPLIKENRLNDLSTLLTALSEEISTRITVINLNGMVLADSEKDPKEMENHRDRLEIREALHGRIGKSIRYSSTLDSEMLYIALPITIEDKTAGVLRLSLFLSHINKLFESIKYKIFEIVLIIILITLLGAFIFSKSISKPIKELTNASHKVAEGDFDVKVFFKKEDELKELSDSFNYMTSQIKDLFFEVSSQKEEISRIISSIQDVLFVLDKEDIIKLSNDNCKIIFDNGEINGKHYWEISKNAELNEMINQAKEEKKNITKRIELNNKIYLASITFIQLKEEMVVLLSDITGITNLEKIKKDFIVNVSHELKTPLTAIKGFVETLDEEENITNKDYIDIIKRHTDRLIFIVQDLLHLSSLEERGGEAEVEKVDLEHLIEKIIRMFDDKVKGKSIKLNLRLINKVPQLSGDIFKLEQMFINLIDNAIKYTDEGSINISLESRNGEVRIEIQDEGIGISEEHLARIFERFYVVDKSRSRKLGGTGLGLSIVKHIVLLHNGKIDVESELGSGTRFIINLPINLL